MSVCEATNVCVATEQKEHDDLFESICILIDAYVRLNINQYIQPNFHELVIGDVMHTLRQTFIDLPEYPLDLTEVERGLTLFYKHIAPARSNGPSFVRRKPRVTPMRKKIAYLQEIPQPEQRTKEWYEFRYKHLTASNIWKAFISESTRNQLIFEKCQPLNTEKFNGVSLDSPMHWGQKYEPVSVALYEQIYAAKVSDFGCIPHRTLDFLAASPDGIVTDEGSLRYGRMLEVKNIVNREINGIPKMEYWVQMQVQMEVCELNECDFLETRFQEYASEEEYAADTLMQYKGMMMLFMGANGKPQYEYAPLSLSVSNPVSLSNPVSVSNPVSLINSISNQWQEAMMDKNSNLTWIKNIYWKLEQISCVLVLRNKLWFKAAIPQLKNIWATIEKEKTSGYSHREPKKIQRNKKPYLGADDDNISMKSQCFITIV